MLTGTPQVPGTIIFTIDATDPNTLNLVGSRTYAIKVAPASSLTVSPTTLRTAVANGNYSVQLMSSGGTGATTFTVDAASSLPAGLSLDPSNGVVSGEASTAGVYTFTIDASDRYINGLTGSQVVHLTVKPGTSLLIGPAALLDATANSSYSATLSAAGGSGTYTYTLASGSALPTGLTLSGSGVLSGTPTVAPGLYFFKVHASDNSISKLSGDQTFSLAVDAPPSITSPDAATFTEGQYGTFTVATAGFPYPTLTLGTSPSGEFVLVTVLPTGLTFTDNGNGTATLAGTPDIGNLSGASQAFTEYFSASNGIQPDYTQDFTLTIDQAPQATTQPANQTVDAGQTASFTAQAGIGDPAPTVQWEVNSGSGFTPLSEGPTYSGVTTDTLTINDATTAMSGNQYEAVFTNGVSPNADSNAATLTVNPAVTLTSAPLLMASAGTPYNQTIAAGNGTGDKALVVSNIQNAIAGLNVPVGGTNSLHVTGKPLGAGTETFTVTATDTISGMATTNYSITVPATPSGTIATDMPLFAWQPLTGGVSEELAVVDQTSGQTQPLLVPNLTGTSYQLKTSQALTRGHDYTWYIGAVGSSARSPGAAVRISPCRRWPPRSRWDRVP